MRHARAGAALTLLALGAAGPTQAQDIIGARDTLAARVDSVFQAFDRTDRPGCAVGVYDVGGIRYARGYGMANLELGAPITPRTVFDVGSVSKQFTALSILLLTQEGRLALNDDVRRYVPELPPYASRVTIRQLLSHTGGVRDYLTLMSLAGWSFEGVADTVDFLRFITRSATTNFPPGTRYLYSNSGYVLAATIIYRLTGEPLARFARRRVFEPLGMTDTRFHDDRSTVMARRAQGYRPRAGGGYGIAMSQFDGNAGPGGLHTTVADLARWIANFEDGALGGSWLDSLQTPVRLANDSAIAYALGLSVGTHRGLRLVSHGGSWAGYRAQLDLYPGRRFAVACLCNVTNAGPDSLARKVAAVYLGGELARDTVARWEAALAAAPAGGVSEARLQALEGVWRDTVLGEVRRTRVVDGRLALGFAAPVPLDPLGDARFRAARGPATEVIFGRDSAGIPAQMVLRTRGGRTTWQRVAAVQLGDGALAEYAGEYFSAELDVAVSVAPDSGRLVLRVNGRRRTALEPTHHDAFGDGSLFIVFTRDRGRITGYVAQAGRVRNLPFVRRPPDD